MERFVAGGLAGACSSEVSAMTSSRLRAARVRRALRRREPACREHAGTSGAAWEEGTMAKTQGAQALRRVGPGFSAPDDASWRDDGYEKSEDEFFESPSLGRGIFVVVFAVVVLCLYMIASGRA